MIETSFLPKLYTGIARSWSGQICNIGSLISGDLTNPLLEGDCLCFNDTKVTFIGSQKDAPEFEYDIIIDALGATMFPGLIDSHVHPTMGEFSPRTDTSHWISHCLHGGVTSMISAGEVHVPGRPTDREGVKALAISTMRCLKNHRPGGVKVMGGAPLLEPDLTREDMKEMSGKGIKLIGEVGIGGVTETSKAAEMVGWAREFRMKSLTHTGGPSIPSSRLMVAEEILEIDPDIIGHINGGHTALPKKDIQCLCESCNRGLEIVHNGNEFAAIYSLNLARELNQLNRITLGSDAPAGSGAPALAMLRLIALLSSIGETPAEQVFCFATGNTAKMRELDAGVLEVGRPADFVIADQPKGGEGKSFLESIELGNLPGIGMVFVDGRPMVYPSQNTPPAETVPEIKSINPELVRSLAASR